MFNSRTESLNFSNLKRNLDDIVKFFMKINYLFGFPTITAGILCNYTLYRVKICSLWNLKPKPASLTRYNKEVGKRWGGVLPNVTEQVQIELVRAPVSP